jgi:hypothetical protein
MKCQRKRRKYEKAKLAVKPIDEVKRRGHRYQSENQYVSMAKYQLIESNMA